MPTAMRRFRLAPGIRGSHDTRAGVVKFACVGALSAAIDFGVLNALLWTAPAGGWQRTLYNTIAVACALVNSYGWNRRWTFAERADGSRSERRRFFLQAALNVALNDATWLTLGGWLSHLGHLQPRVADDAAKAAAMLVSSTASYELMRRWVFRRDPAAGTPPSPSCESRRAR
ncbi:GtrA family protein [Alicyclobacillus macrosporangiidus]|uniref:GtrA family protein n=1 Tax=Alicyclobacillus macrosporangiidus TaxID=392015 RepID=UPI0006896C6B|nr:GtrA family protein [Alicyclobacillus macrosporangiidus]